jgi:hypothetical protein
MGTRSGEGGTVMCKRLLFSLALLIVSALSLEAKEISSQQIYNPHPRLTITHFTDEQSGLGLDSSGTLFQTTDGGTSWWKKDDAPEFRARNLKSDVPVRPLWRIFDETGPDNARGLSLSSPKGIRNQIQAAPQRPDPYVVDTVLIISNDTVRRTYSYNTLWKKTGEYEERISGGNATPIQRWTFTYDAQGILNSTLQERYADSGWAREVLVEDAFDGSGRLLTRGRYTRANTGPDEYWSWAYDSDGRVLQSVHQTWRDGTQPVYGSRWTYRYDQGGRLLARLLENWPYAKEQWGNMARETYSYNADTSTTLGEYWNGEQWTNDWLKTKEYDGNGLLRSETMANWRERSWFFAWENFSRDVYSYTAGGRMAWQNTHYWQEGKWALSERNGYGYDAGGRMSSILLQCIDTSEQWVDYNQWRWEYDADGRLVTYGSWLRNPYGDWVQYEDFRWSFDSTGRLFARSEVRMNCSRCVPGYRQTFSYARHQYWIAAAGQGYLPPFPIVDGGGNANEYYGISVSITYRSMTTGVGETGIASKENALPGKFSLGQNYPNPFNPSTTIAYDLPNDAHVRLTVYNTLGQEITTLVNDAQKAGHRTITWNGAAVASGVYYYRLEAGSFVNVKKLLLLK